MIMLKNRWLFILCWMLFFGTCFAANLLNELSDEEMTELQELIKQPPPGPCHGVVYVEECIRWVNDSANVKKEKHPDYKWEVWRQCCDDIRDSIDATKPKRKKKRK